MNYSSNLNYRSDKSEKSEIAQNSEAVDKLIGNLDSIILENTFAEQNFSTPINPVFNSNSVPPKGLYVTEIDDRFYLLDYAIAGLDPKPVPLESSALAKSPHPSVTKTESKLQSESISNTGWFSGNRGILVGVAVGMLLTLGATKILAPQTTTEGNAPEVAEVSQPNALAQTVTAIEVIDTDIDRTLNASGTVAAYERIPVMSQASGLQITDVLVERGEYVERGQILARLNNRVLSAEKTQAEGAVSQARARLAELQAGSRREEIARAESRVANARSAVAQAQSDLELVQKRVKRNTSLQAEGAISRDRLDEILNQERVARSELAKANANLEEARQELAQLKAGSRPETIAQAEAELVQAQGRLEAIEAQLADTTINAPRAGIIASREAKVGQITANSEMLFTIIQDGRLELQLQVPETSIGKIQPGQKVVVSSNSNPDLQLTGKVRQIDPAIDESSRQATVRVDLPAGSNLKPGMFLQAAINTDTARGQAVPIEALLPQSGNRAIAFVVQPDNTVKAQTVTMGEILPEQRVEVIEGLQPGDRIVLEGAAYLKDGDRVTVAKNWGLFPN